MSKNTDLQDKKNHAAQWFQRLQEDIIAALEVVEYNGKFSLKEWQRQGEDHADNDAPRDPSKPLLKGGGRIGLLKGGDVFEKAGVNFSEVHGIFSDKFAREIPGAQESEGAFWASGVSLVIHPRSPHVPIIHMNTRMICTSKCWFGGGMDLTPIVKDRYPQDTQDFHSACEQVCARHGGVADYERFKAWCEDYFYLPHRGETRGVGGIFYDYLEEDWDKTFAFTKDVGQTFARIYPEIVLRHRDKSWTPEEADVQLIRRGRYVEFNLICDRGTRFGLMSGGNTEAILMSMPPLAAWE